MDAVWVAVVPGATAFLVNAVRLYALFKGRRPFSTRKTSLLFTSTCAIYGLIAGGLSLIASTFATPAVLSGMTGLGGALVVGSAEAAVSRRKGEYIEVDEDDEPARLVAAFQGAVGYFTEFLTGSLDNALAELREERCQVLKKTAVQAYTRAIHGASSSLPLYELLHKALSNRVSDLRVAPDSALGALQGALSLPDDGAKLDALVRVADDLRVTARVLKRAIERGAVQVSGVDQRIRLPKDHISLPAESPADMRE